MMDLKEKIRTIRDFPEPGILFRDITTLLSDAEALNEMIERFTEHYRDEKIDLVVGIESRGFIIGAPLAIRLGKDLFRSGRQENFQAQPTGWITNWNMGKTGLKCIKTPFPKEAGFCSSMI